MQAVPWAAHFPNSVNGSSPSCLLNIRSPQHNRWIPQSKQAGGGWQHPTNIKKLSSSSPYKALQEVTAPVGAGHGAAEIQTLINLSQNSGRAERYREVTLGAAEQQSSLLIFLLICFRASGCANAARDQNRNLQTWITSNSGSNSRWSSYTFFFAISSR